MNGIQEIVYQAPAQVTSDEVDTVSFTVYDEQLTTLVSGTASVQLDADMTKVYLQGYFNTVSAPATAPTGNTTTGAPITGSIFGNAIINGTSASQTITAYGYNNTINANGGNDVIYAGLGQATVTVSNGNGNNTISGALGNTSVTLGNGNNNISLSGYFDVVTLGNGNNTVTGPQGNAQVTVGNGSNVITLGGYFNVVHAGSTTGTDYINAGIGNATVTGGNGNFVVLAGGYSDVVTLGNGNDDVFTSPAGSNPSVPTGSTAPAEQGLAVVTTGSGNDTIILGGYDNTVNAGSGMNFIGGALGLNTFVLASSGFDEIAGFSTTNGDTLNVAAALQAAGWNLAPATLGNYLKVADANNNAIISVVKGGSGAGSAIAQLDGVGNLTLAGLQNHLIL
ncbi:calcium-binding protein [Acidisphaera sp. S103]|uniref:calcium-binding protein n=1 Tax=Acidisphaera sp. S103 TaxID=1747223 RepID=UPI00131C9567|nr:calcium-binding protein [Acidisphaera sp. S103]